MKKRLSVVIAAIIAAGFSAAINASEGPSTQSSEDLKRVGTAQLNLNDVEPLTLKTYAVLIKEQRAKGLPFVLVRVLTYPLVKTPGVKGKQPVAHYDYCDADTFNRRAFKGLKEANDHPMQTYNNPLNNTPINGANYYLYNDDSANANFIPLCDYNDIFMDEGQREYWKDLLSIYQDTDPRAQAQAQFRLAQQFVTGGKRMAKNLMEARKYLDLAAKQTADLAIAQEAKAQLAQLDTAAANKPGRYPIAKSQAAQASGGISLPQANESVKMVDNTPLNINDREPLTSKTYAALIDAQHAKGFAFILARVTTYPVIVGEGEGVDAKGRKNTALHYNYYDAQAFNDQVFKGLRGATDRQMLTFNDPQNAMPIIGVTYYILKDPSDAAFVTLCNYADLFLFPNTRDFWKDMFYVNQDEDPQARAKAQLNVAIHYIYGTIVGKNLAQARKYLDLAANQTADEKVAQDAKEQLAQLNRVNRQ